MIMFTPPKSRWPGTPMMWAIALTMLSFTTNLYLAYATHGLSASVPYAIIAVVCVVACLFGLRAAHRHSKLAAGLERDSHRQLISANADAAAAARRSEARLDAVLKGLPIGIVQIDMDGRIEMANDKAARLLGRPVMQLPGQSISEMVHIADRADLRMFFEGLSDTDRPRDLRLRATIAGRPALRVHGGLANDAGPDRGRLLLAIEKAA